MFKRRGKYLTWILVMLLLVTCIPVQAKEASSLQNQPLSSAAKISLEQATQTVKANFTIPSKLNDFNSSYDNNKDRQYWRLEWSSAENDGGNFSAEVDATSGEIVRINRWSQSDSSFSKTPSLSALEARKIGQELLARLLPTKDSSLVFQDDSSLIPLGEYESPRYSMTWQRAYQGINVAMDSVRMEIDMQTGEVSSYSLNWTEQALPNPASVIPADQARQVFVSQEILQLQYFLAQSYKPVASAQTVRPQLIYGIRHPSNGMIDAVSGKVLDYGGYNYIYGRSGMVSLKLAKDAIGGSVPVILSPEEQKEIAASDQYISQEQAVEIVNKWLAIPAKMKLESASLDKDWQNPGTRCWSLRWNQTVDEAGKNNNLWAQVDAASGELLSFNLNLATEQATNKNDIIDQKAAQVLAENFIINIQPQRWSELKLDEQNVQPTAMDMNPPTWSFNYLRLVNGILCPDNGIEVAIDASNKKVTSYRLNWSKRDFTTTGKVIDKAQANDVFLKAAPLTLNYTLVPGQKGQEEIKLVYMPEMKNELSMIDAITGQGLNGAGQTIENNPQAYTFNDIQGHFGEKEIRLLGQAGILGEYGGSFHPEEKIKLLPLLRAMLTAKNGVYSTRQMDDQEIIKRCQNLKWIDDKATSDSSVSREQLAQLMIRFLNIDYLSLAQGIYQLPYKDAGKMSAQTKAYAALCYGLGIIKADGKNFNGSHTISRAEAAVALVHTLSIKTRP